MNLLSVNCRGCGWPETVQELPHVEQTVRLAVLFLMETKMHRDRAMVLKKSLGFPNAEAISSEGLSGGLMLLWRGNVTVAIESLSRSQIDILVSCEALGVRHWCLTGFYGEL